MDLNQVRSLLTELTTLVGEWGAPDEISALERDLALEKLRKLYDAVRFDGASDAPRTAGAAPASEPVVGVVPVSIDLGEVLSLDTVSGAEPDDTPVAVCGQKPEVPLYAEPADKPGSADEFAKESEPAIEPEPEPAPESEPGSEPVPASEPVTEPERNSRPVYTAPTLFGVEEQRLRHRHKQRVIMSLYDSEPAPTGSEPVAKPVPEKPAPTEPLVEKPAAPQTEWPIERPAAGMPPEHPAASGAVLGEVINHDVQTLADTIAPPRDMASELRRGEPVGDLRTALGINDKFLIIRDLFHGDAAAYETAVETFNGFGNLDDCMIYIAENYAWNANSDGAKLLMELLERKFA